MKFAKDEGISIPEALKNSELKAILDVRAEERRTASATQTRSARGVARPTGEDLLRKAEKTGELPSSSEDMTALAEARIARKRADRAN